MFSFIKKHWKMISVLVVVIIIGIPLLIHVLFKFSSPCDFFAASWTAGDILAFYGVLIGSIATIVGVYISITAANANYREDIIKRSLPFMALTPLLCKTKNIFEEIQVKNEDIQHSVFQEYNLDKVYFIIHNGIIKICNELSEEQKQIVEYGGYIKEDRGEFGFCVKSAKSIYTPLEIENVGNGAASTFSIGFNHISVPEDKQIFTLARTLKVGQKYHVALFSENTDDNNFGEYTLCISYYDILGNGYEQNYKYTIYEESHRIYAQLKMDGTQQPRKASTLGQR